MTDKEIRGTVQPTYWLSGLNNTVGFVSELLLLLVCRKAVNIFFFTGSILIILGEDKNCSTAC